MNIFEGSRRITTILAWSWAIFMLFVCHLDGSAVNGVIPALIGIIIIYGLSKLIGYIVRGFLGIPKGWDTRDSGLRWGD